MDFYFTLISMIRYINKSLSILFTRQTVKNKIIISIKNKKYSFELLGNFLGLRKRLKL